MISKIKQYYSDESNKRLVANFGSLFTLNAANYLLPLITLPYLVIVLGTENFGVIMFAQALIVYFNLLVEFGFNMSATREISINQKDNKKISEIFTSVFIIKITLLLISALLLFALICGVEFFAKNREIYIFTFLMVIGQMLFPSWLFQGMERMKFITLINILAKLIFTLSVFIFIKESKDFYIVPILNSAGFIIAGILGLIIGIRMFKIKLVMPKPKELVYLFKESANLFISNLSVSLYTATNTVILGLFYNDHIVGIYASIEKLVLAIKGMFTPLYQAMFPWLSKKANLERDKVIKFLLKYITIIAILGMSFIIGLSEWFLDLLYNNAQITDAHYILQIFAFITLAAGLNMLFVSLYFPVVKAYSVRMKILLFGGIFNIISVFIATKLFAMTGTAVAVVTTEFFILILAIYYFNKVRKHG